MYNDELILIDNNITYDKAGDKVETPVEKHVVCEVRSATRREFYDYASNTLRPEYVATMNLVEYDNEKKAIFRGERYQITRSFITSRDLVELTLSRRLTR